MKRLYYSVKAILKHRVSIIVFCILLLFNFFSMIDTMRASSKETLENTIREYKLGIHNTQVTIDNRSAIDLSNPSYTEEEKDYLRNYFAMNQWVIDRMKLELDMIEAGEDISEAVIVRGLVTEMSVMDYVLDDRMGYEYSFEVFADELKRHADLIDVESLPFDLATLHLHPYINSYLGTEQRDVNYQTSKKFIEYYFYLLDHNLPDLELTSLSPWSFLMKQIGVDSLVPFMTFPLALIFAMVYLYDLKQKESLKLLLTQGSDRRTVIFTQTLALGISFILLYLASLLIPTLILGLQGGWEGLTLPILTDMQGLTSFEVTEHLDVLNTFKLSTFPAKRYIDSLSSYYFIPDGMDYMDLWKVLLISGGLAVFKFLTAISIGSMCIYCSRKKWQPFGLLAVFMLVYLISQGNGAGVLSAWSVFDLRSTLMIVQGCTHITTLHALCICLGTLIVTGLCSVWLFRNSDYNG